MNNSYNYITRILPRGEVQILRSHNEKTARLKRTYIRLKRAMQLGFSRFT